MYMAKKSCEETNYSFKYIIYAYIVQPTFSAGIQQLTVGQILAELIKNKKYLGCMSL